MITDGASNMLPFSTQRYADLFTMVRKLDGVGKQVNNDLHQSVPVNIDGMCIRRSVEMDCDAIMLGGFTLLFDGCFNDIGQARDLLAENHFTGFDFLDIENIVDQLHEAFAIIVSNIDHTRHFLGHFTNNPGADQAQRPLNRRKRCAQFM